MHLFNCIWQGFLTGIVLSLMLGTVFFSLIRNSLHHGHRTGVYIAMGVIVCDVLFISLGILSHGFAIFLKQYEREISMIGGSILAIMGIYMVIKAKPEVKEGKDLAPEQNKGFYYFANGFLLNLLNPVNFFSWLAISSMLTIKYNYEIHDKVVFFVASLASIFIVEVLIAHSASRLKQLITPKVLKHINQLSGLIFIAMGCKLALGAFF